MFRGKYCHPLEPYEKNNKTSIHEEDMMIKIFEKLKIDMDHDIIHFTNN